MLNKYLLNIWINKEVIKSYVNKTDLCQNK
jgi:hypothetical protein